MADTKVSALTAVTTPAGTDEFPVNQAGTSKKMTLNQVDTFVTTAPVFAAGSASANTWPKMTSGTVLTTPEAGALEYDGSLFYASPVASRRGLLPAMYFRALNADATGNDSATAQGWFPTNGAVNVEASTTYFFHGHLHTSRAGGATSHTTGISVDGGTCTFNSVQWWGEAKEGDVSTISDSDLLGVSVATDTNIKAASTSTTENVIFGIWGIARINAAGTFKPMFKYSAAPGGAPTIKRGTYFYMHAIGGTGDVTLGTWS